MSPDAAAGPPDPKAGASTPGGGVAAIRPARAGDLEACTAIYNTYVINSHVTFDIHPCTVEARRPWFDGFAPTGPYRLFVAETAGEILGYASSTRHRAKPGYDSTVETTIYLASGVTGRGIGGVLYASLLDTLDREPGLHRAFAGIALPNEASCALHRALGFKPLGTFREVGRKFDRYWDVEWYERALGPMNMPAV